MTEVWCGKDSLWRKGRNWSSIFCLFAKTADLCFSSSSSSLIAVVPLEKMVLWEVWFAQNKINSSSHSTNSFQEVLPRSDLCLCSISFLHVARRNCSTVGLYQGMKWLRARWRGQQRCRGRGTRRSAHWGPLENCSFTPYYTAFTECNQTRQLHHNSCKSMHHINVYSCLFSKYLCSSRWLKYSSNLWQLMYLIMYGPTLRWGLS